MTHFEGLPVDESRKTNQLRSQSFKDRYLQGRVIDIGAGRDVVTPTAEAFDLEHGDANRILQYREAGAYDAVHSSHCLEHMQDPPAALLQWWGLLRPGGHLIVVVPEESLYEQGYWPSPFNPDHKATFRLRTTATWSPVSHDIAQLCAALPGAELLEAELQDQGYDHRLRPAVRRRSAAGEALGRFMARVRGRVLRLGAPGQWLEPLVTGLCRLLGCPVDQTLTGAVAQIQVVVHKA